MVLICPYCDIEINEKLVEAEDGCCPECGTLITARSVAEQYEGEENEDIYEEDEFANEFNDELAENDDYEDDFNFDEFLDDPSLKDIKEIEPEGAGNDMDFEELDPSLAAAISEVKKEAKDAAKNTVKNTVKNKSAKSSGKKGKKE